MIGSFPAPTREVGWDAFPIGLALLRGRLYVNNYNRIYNCTDDDLFAVDPSVGTVLGRAKTPGCNPMDGMASIPEAGLLVGIEVTVGNTAPTDSERLHFFRPSFSASSAGFALTEVGVIDVDVPGNSVRGLAYRRGKLYVSEEDTGSIYIYRLKLHGMTVEEVGAIRIGTAAPGLTYGRRLVAYDIRNHKVLVVEARRDGQIVDEIDLAGTGALGESQVLKSA